MQYTYYDSIPYDKRVLYEILRVNAEKRADQTCFIDLIDGPTNVTFQELKEKVDHLAAHLYRTGIRKGMHVGILMPTSRDYIYLWFALAKLGAVEVPYNIVYKGDTLAYLINDSDAQFLLVDEEFIPELEKVKAKLEYVKTVIYHGQPPTSNEDKWKTYHWSDFEADVHEAIEQMNLELEGNPVCHEDPACIIYTSGTTGPSKGVLITNHHLYFMGLFQADIMHYTDRDISLNFLPFYHVAAKFIALGCMISGAKMILKNSFSVTTFWDEVREYDVTIFPAVGGIMTMLYNQTPQSNDQDHSVRAVYAIPAPKENYKEIQERFGIKLVEAYGSTEWSAVTATEMDENVIGSCGRAIDRYVEVMIVDEHDHPCQFGEAGELVVRPKLPHTVMIGYYNKPDKTVEAWQNLWFHTGDRFYQDKQGYLYFIDRIKDAIRRKGENISSFEMESMLTKHPKISECAVIAVPSPIGEDDIKAFIVLQKDSHFSYEEIILYCYENLGYFMVPRYIEFMDELPRTPTGKILKNPLRNAIKERFSSNTWDCEEDGGIKITSKGLKQLSKASQKKLNL